MLGLVAAQPSIIWVSGLSDIGILLTVKCSWVCCLSSWQNSRPMDNQLVVGGCCWSLCLLGAAATKVPCPCTGICMSSVVKRDVECIKMVGVYWTIGPKRKNGANCICYWAIGPHQTALDNSKLQFISYLLHNWDLLD